MKTLVLIAALTMLVVSCSHQPPVSVATAGDAASRVPPKYSIVCIVHGDGEYGVHDESGAKNKADERVVSKMLQVASSNPKAEVFVFHQKHRRRFLLVFPRHDGEFYCIRNGTLVAHESYWRDQGNSRFDPETELYRRYHEDSGDPQTRLFLYFGHEIPESGGHGYDASYSNRAFTIDDLALGLSQFSGNSSRFDLAMLSTCYNGTPYTIAKLAPHARYIIASPGNLHLSYFDPTSFESLDQQIGTREVSDFALACAHQSFDRLQKDIQTEITVAVYDVDSVRKYVDSVDSLYGKGLSQAEAAKRLAIDHCDCAEDSTYVTSSMSDGVTILYRPARFGRSKNKAGHSGWGCLKLPE